MLWLGIKALFISCSASMLIGLSGMESIDGEIALESISMLPELHGNQ